MRFLFRVVSEAADTARDILEMVVGAVVGTVLFLAILALRMLVYIITVAIALALIYWVYSLIPHH